MQSFTSVPFKTESGLSSVNGVARFSAAGIVLEFESKLFGLISTGVKEARLPMADLLDVKFKKGVMKRGSKIEIRLNSFSALTKIPNSEGKITLKIDRDDFERARDAVAQLELARVEFAASQPPPHTPLRSLFDESEDDTQELKD
jgi:hypothetical protein